MGGPLRSVSQLNHLLSSSGAPQVRLLLQQSTRLVAAGELASGELAATLAGLSGLQGVDVAEEGPEEVAELLEVRGSQGG